MSKQIIVGKNLVTYNRYGSESGDINLIFLHGWRSSKEVWGEAVNRLIKKSVNSTFDTAPADRQQISYYAIDLPGFGASPAPKGNWTVGDYAGAVSGFIEKLELKNVVLVGHSFGGRVGVKIASHSGGHNSPQLSHSSLRKGVLKKLILVDAAGFALGETKKSLYSLIAKVAKPFFRPKFMQGLRRYIYGMIGADDYLATPKLQETFVNITREDLSEDLKRICVPTLLVWGAEDKDTPIEFGQRMKSLIHNSQFKILPKAGHFSFLDQPDEFVKILAAFIESN